MLNEHRTSLAETGARPVHPIFVPIAATFMLGALVTDVLYIETYLGMWETFSIWLLTAAMIMAGIGGIALLVDLVGRRSLFRPVWCRVLACVVGALLSLINAFIHSRDGWDAVVPSGVTISAIVAVIVVYLAWNRWDLSARRVATR
ncbi:MAG TPA: DUF2231 domain-containing protein [Rhodopila sp.]|jgi:uncharacterized membrane protein|nr:DUF2231 domain-containing protein [Rhodopila sp.]